MRRTFWPVALVIGVLVLLIPVPARAQVPTVRLSNWEQAANGTGVVFKPSTPVAVPDAIPALPDATASGAFEYGIDVSDVKWADECRCFRYYTVTVRSVSTGRVSRHKFRAHPSGSFEDQGVPVRLSIAESAPRALTDFDDVVLPVASAPGLEPAPLVSVQPRETISPVSLGGSSEIQLVLRNPSKHTAVQVPSDITVFAEENYLWKQVAVVSATPFPLTLPPSGSEVVRITVQPNTWEAIQESIVPSSSDKAHTSFHIKVPYTNTQFQQRDGVKELELPVRFRPSIISLAVALIVGVGLGSLVPLVSRKTGSLGRWSRAIVAAFVVALVLELVGIFLVANNSKFMVFNFDLDPWQTLPVLLLGIGNGLLGLEAGKRLKFIKEGGAA